MVRYKIEDLKNNLIQIRVTSIEQANKIWQAYGQTDHWNIGDGKSEFYIFGYLDESGYDSYPSWMPDSQYFKNEYGVDKTIEFSQIDFQENLVECIEIW